MWNDSSQQIFFMIRAYGAYEHLRSAFWETIACRVDEPRDDAYVAPRAGRIVEDVVELALPDTRSSRQALRGLPRSSTTR